MTRLKTISPLSVVLILAIISSLTLAPTVWAQDDTGADVTGGGTTEGNVQFTPGYIKGTVSMDGESVQNARIRVVRNLGLSKILVFKVLTALLIAGNFEFSDVLT